MTSVSGKILRKIVTSETYTIQHFTDPSVLALQLANDIALRLNDAINKKGRAVLALSGGSTPKPMLQALSQLEVDWNNVIVTLVDERCVAPGHELSNATMLSNCLLNNLEMPPSFAPLYFAGLGEQNLVERILAKYCELTDSNPTKIAAFDVVILGMGSDGHTASFFPDADNIEQLLAMNSAERLLMCNSPSTQVPRITWSLPMLLNTSMLILHITGKDKREVLEQALMGDDFNKMPIRAAIFQDVTPLNIYSAV